MQLIDSHCHLDFKQFDDDVEQVIADAIQSKISHFVVPGVSPNTWQKQLQLADKIKHIHCAFGIHPWFLTNDSVAALKTLESFIQLPQTVAVGECGLDSEVDNIPLQKEVFLAQIKLANLYNKPLIVHHRKSHHLIHQCFKQCKPKNGGVVHAFSGSIEDANKYIDLGFKMGVGGGITYARASKTQATILQIGLDNIMLETDSPDMPIFGRQGKRNEPKYIVDVANSVAQIFSCSLDDVANKTSENTKFLFSI